MNPAAVTLEELERRIIRLESRVASLLISPPSSPDDAAGIYPLILKSVALAHKLSVAQLVSNVRTEHFANARFMGMHLVRKLTGAPMLAISEVFGRIDHGAAIHGLQRAEHLLKTNKAFAFTANTIEAEIRKKMEAPCA